MKDIKARFTKWYVKKGYRFGYDFEDCDIIGDEHFKSPYGMPIAYWICPKWVKPLLMLFSPSIYTTLTIGADFVRGFQKGLNEGNANG